MRIRVVPYAELRRLVSNGEAEVWLDLPAGASVADALAKLNIVTKDRLIIGVDGTYATPETQLHENAELTLVTPMMGGQAEFNVPRSTFKVGVSSTLNVERLENHFG